MYKLLREKDSVWIFSPCCCQKQRAVYSLPICQHATFTTFSTQLINLSLTWPCTGSCKKCHACLNFPSLLMPTELGRQCTPDQPKWNFPHWTKQGFFHDLVFLRIISVHIDVDISRIAFLHNIFFSFSVCRSCSKAQTYRGVYPDTLNPPTFDENFRTRKMAGWEGEKGPSERASERAAERRRVGSYSHINTFSAVFGR